MKKIKVDQSDKLVIDLTPAILAGARSYPKKLGRYSASMIYKMLEAGNLPWGLPPDKYFDIEEPDLDGALRMINGIQNHELAQKYMPNTGRNEIKFEYEHKVDGVTRFVVVGKVDRLEDEYVGEIKSSDTIFTSAKDYHIHQAKLYATMAERPFSVVFQPLIEGNKFILKEIGRVERDDEWFAQEMARLLNYHERLELILADKK